ncbi:MAG: hypothetical protein MJE66_04535 [Proteobacteria bacterium]|nr:hypothetical protein [Pseudomonadota bacterium]
MSRPDLPEILRIAAAAADRARAEIMPRFRCVGVEQKADGSPVTEADRAAEQAIREVLREATPDYGILGEEYGHEQAAGRPCWVVDPIDGTLSFSRGIPLFGTLLALLVEEEPVAGLIDLPALGERYTGHRGGGCRRNGEPVTVSQADSLDTAVVSHGDPYAFERAGRRPLFEWLAREAPILRGYTDAFGHAMVLGGAVDVMIDLNLNAWDLAATRILVPEAGGRIELVRESGDKCGAVFGSPALVERVVKQLD